MRTLAPMKTLFAMFALAITVSGCAAISGRETAGEYVDDATVTAKVKADILKEPSLKSLQISVETMQDVVQLSGFVDKPQARIRAGEIARAVQGVRSVKNDLVVK